MFSTTICARFVCLTEKNVCYSDKDTSTHLLSEAVYQLILITFCQIRIILYEQYNVDLHRFAYKEPVENLLKIVLFDFYSHV